MPIVNQVREDDARRVREGDLDHLIFYALQSTRFTRRPPIEPALSAKALHESGQRVPADVRARIGDLLKAIDSSSVDPRLTYFRALMSSTFPKGPEREDALVREYTRVMKFVYDKEFVAQRAGTDAVVGAVPNPRAEHRYGSRGGVRCLQRTRNPEIAGFREAYPPGAHHRTRTGPRASHRISRDERASELSALGGDRCARLARALAG